MKEFKFIVKKTSTSEVAMSPTASSFSDACAIAMEQIKSFEKEDPYAKFSLHFKNNEDAVLHYLNEEYFKGDDAFSDYHQLYDYLTIRFNNKLLEIPVATIAYEYLNKELDGLLSKYFILSTNEFYWDVSLLPNFNINYLMDLSAILGTSSSDELIKKLNREISFLIDEGLTPDVAFNTFCSHHSLDLSKCIHFYSDDVEYILEPRNMDNLINLPF